MRQLRSLMNSWAWRGIFASRDPGGSAAPRLILAGQQAAAEREVGQYPQAECLGRRNEVALDLAREQAVLVLAGHERGKRVLPRRGLCLDDLLRRKIRTAEETDLALLHQIIERAQGFLDRGLWVRVMQLVKIDPIGAQPL